MKARLLYVVGIGLQRPHVLISFLLEFQQEWRTEASLVARLARAFLARLRERVIDRSVAVQTKGFGLASPPVRKRCGSRLGVFAWRVISAKRRSMRLSQEEDVGIKCSLKCSYPPVHLNKQVPAVRYAGDKVKCFTRCGIWFKLGGSTASA
jgi:hypothetical protein